MIWYLLYPFRGTTEAPELAPTHPLRSALARYGRYASSHVGTTLLISVAVASILIYPLPFLYTTDFTNAASNLPHHVWTEAQPLDKGSYKEPDVIMRSIWVHGSYMKALDRDVLLGAMELQDYLLGPTMDFNPRRSKGVERPANAVADLTPMQRDAFHVANGLTNESWFFHSPLQYWSCSSELIAADADIVGTVNAKKTQPTSVNVTLRHSIVFSGKRFEDRSLVAADAVVVTLIHLRDSPIGERWVEKAKELKRTAVDRWDMYSLEDKSELYEFQFRPMSFSDGVVLALAYTLTLLYFLMSTTRLRAVKSKAGLFVTVMVQIVVSMLSSLTVCAIYKIDVSRIPYFAYPIVSLAITTENVFRLVNAVILTPPENSISTRIGYAFGETGYVALASVAQNALILYGFSKVTLPGISAFCRFAAVSILFDFFYLSTFFLSVLSVDIRRAELSDALNKASGRGIQMHRSSSADHYGGRRRWTDAVLQGRLALSTRIAGTVVMIGFVLIAQWHFFENESVLRALARIFRMPGLDRANLAAARSSLLVDVHQARSPTSWLRLQDHETAREVISVVKPWSHSYVARVYDPLVFVVKGADRNPPASEGTLLPAVYDFARHQLTPFALTVVIIVAAVRLLLNYLLWDELAGLDDGGKNDARLSIKTLDGGHLLDIAMMAASSEGHIVTVGYDRLIRVWDIKSGGKSYVVDDPDNPIDDPFPILSMAVDEDSNWMALLTSYRVLLWNLQERRWGPSMSVEVGGTKPEAFFFSYDQNELINPIVIVRRDGTLTIVRPEHSSYLEQRICQSPLISVKPLIEQPTAAQPQLKVRVLTASRKGCVHVATETTSKDWDSQSKIRPPPQSEQQQRELISVVPLSALSLFLVVRARSVDLVDVAEQNVIHTFDTEAIQPKSLRCLHSSRRRAHNGTLGLASLTLAYVAAATKELLLETYLPAEGSDTICAREGTRPDGVSAGPGSCTPWDETVKVTRAIPNPGSWEALPNGCIVGIRRRTALDAFAAASSGSSRISSPPSPGGAAAAVRRRRQPSAKVSASGALAPDSWEVWLEANVGNTHRPNPPSSGAVGGGGGAGASDSDGGGPKPRPHHPLEDEEHNKPQETVPLYEPAEAGSSHLFVARLGPMVKVGTASVAVGLGNVVKVVTVGNERFGRIQDSLVTDALASVRRRRPGGPASRTRATVWN